jgi:hypothetical protein
MLVVGIASPEAKAAAVGAAVAASVAAFGAASVAAFVAAFAAEDVAQRHDAGMSAVVAGVPLEEADTAATLGTAKVR